MQPRLVAHWIRKAKRKIRRKFRRPEPEGGTTIDLSLVRGSIQAELDQVHVEHELGGENSGSCSKRPSGGTLLTCPQLLALGGAIGALPQVALGNAKVVGLPDWKELSSSLRKAKPFSVSAPILSITQHSAPGSPNSVITLSRSPPLDRGEGKEEPRKRSRHHKSHESSGSDIFSVSHRNSKELGPFRSHVRRIVESKPFQQGILGAILINTLSMGVEYHDQVKNEKKMYYFFGARSNEDDGRVTQFI